MLPIWLLLLVAVQAAAAEVFRVATYNLEGYLDRPTASRPVKTVAARAKIRESIHAMRPDVLALQEIGGTAALEELRASLKAEGLVLDHRLVVEGFDTNIQVAVLSRFPISANRSHPRESFLLKGRRHRVSRGFAEVDLRVNTRYSFTLFNAHLKSRRPVPEADENEIREQEARLLREKIEACVRRNPEGHVIVMGDLNDLKDSVTYRVILGANSAAPLVDLRPAERNGDHLPNPVPYFEPRHVTWTHYYGKQDTYSRIDYVFINRALRRFWRAEGTYVLSLPNWGLGSDHRPLVAEFAIPAR